MTRPGRGRAGRLLVAATAAALSIAACGSPSTGSKQGALSGTVTVFAASSLTEAFITLGKRFEAAHPGLRVVFNFGPSSGLAQQIVQGAPADVFASASGTTMEQVVEAGGARVATPFVKNVMEIAVPPSNPAHVTSVADLAKGGVTVALCQPQVPCGETAAKVFANAHVAVTPVTQELDVKSVLAKVELGEVDAGVVYVTDVRGAGNKVRGIAIDPSVNASTTYPLAALTKARNATAAQTFEAYVLSPAGTAVLTAAGFEAP